MDGLTISGIVLEVQPPVLINEKLTKQMLAIDTGGDYPNQIPIEFLNDKTDMLAGIAPGTRVNVHVNIRGRVGKPDQNGNNRYWLSLNGWKVEVGDSVKATEDAPF